MTVKEICERLANVESITNDRVYIVNYDSFRIKMHILLGFIHKVEAGSEMKPIPMNYAILDDVWPDKSIKVKIEDVYADEDSAKKALNAHIQGLIDNLELKKL